MSARPPRLTLQADTAADLMGENPISIREDASVQEAIVLMTDRGYSIAPVIDERGRPVGVVSVTDVLIHDRECVRFLKPSVEVEMVGAGPPRLGNELEIEDRTKVADIMTPTVFTIRHDALVGEVVQTMNSYGVHHLFVSDDDGTLIGVIGLSDIVRHLG